MREFYFMGVLFLFSKVQERIRDLRLENNLSQEDLKEYDLSLRTVQRIENISEPANITLLTLFLLSKDFGVKPEDLFDI